jgi:hypothetical protein
MYTGSIFPKVIRKACLIPWCVNENLSTSSTSRYWPLNPFAECPARYSRFPSESWSNISSEDCSEVYVVFSRRIAMECLYSNCSAKESGSYLKQYALKL